MAGLSRLPAKDQREGKKPEVVSAAPGNRKLVCSGCGRRFSEVAEVYDREVRDLALVGVQGNRGD